MRLKFFLEKYFNKKTKKDFVIKNVSEFDYDVKKNGIFLYKKEVPFIYLQNAIKNGAKTIIYDSLKKMNFSSENLKGINFIKLNNPHLFLAKLLQVEQNTIFKDVIFIGVSGTSGKTTTTHLVFDFLKEECFDVLYIGTHFIHSFSLLKGESFDTINTTLSLSKIYNLLHQNHYDYVIMEVSSQSLVDSRILGLEFDIVCITNLSSDHLDFHETKNSYKLAKSLILDKIKKSSKYKKIILNKDDDYEFFLKRSIYDVSFVGFNCDDMKVSNVCYSIESSSFNLRFSNKNYFVKTTLPSKFNIYNILFALRIIDILGLSVNLFLKSIKNKEIKGRMNILKKNEMRVIIDYAHTENEIDEVISFVNKVKTKEKVLVIVGAGGSRDKTKRKRIREIVNDVDFVIFTEDNSRGEDLDLILNELTFDLKKDNFCIIKDRKEAIKYGLSKEMGEKIVLILGKGAEKQIIRQNEIILHSDIEFVKEVLREI